MCSDNLCPRFITSLGGILFQNEEKCQDYETFTFWPTVTIVYKMKFRPQLSSVMREWNENNAFSKQPERISFGESYFEFGIFWIETLKCMKSFSAFLRHILWTICMSLRLRLNIFITFWPVRKGRTLTCITTQHVGFVWA